MKLLVFGASGKTGHEIVRQALIQGHDVTAFVRNPAKLKVQHPNLDVYLGNVIDFEKVSEVVEGQDAVLSALGASSPFRYDQAVVDGAQNILQAMQTNGVKRFVYMSFVGLKDSRNAAGFVIKYVAPKILSSEIAGHEAREEMIRQSALDWTIVRAVTLTNGNRTGLYRVGENISSGGFTSTISRADVAECMLRQLADDRFVRKTIRVMR